MNKIEFVDLKRQLFGDPLTGLKGIKPEIDTAINACSSQTSFIMGPFLETFEREFASYCGAQYCVGLNSGTDALEFALRCNSITSGEVITVPNTYFTSVSSITQVGATPVFVDIDEKTFNMDIEALQKAITSNTVAILVVHMYGRPAQMDRILEIAHRHKLKVIEDCAHAPGARFAGKRVPISGTGAFSFFPGKNIGAWGDAGCLVTNDAKVARLARLWRNDGWEKKYRHEIKGRKARLDSLQAAILSVKLRYLDKWNTLRLQHAYLYNSLLSGVKGIQLPLLNDNTIEPVFHLYTLLLDKRDALLDYLTSQNISAGIHYPTPVHLQPAYLELGLREGSFPIAESIAKRTLSLPLFPELRKDEIERVCGHITQFLT